MVREPFRSESANENGTDFRAHPRTGAFFFKTSPTIGLDVVSQKRVREFLRIYNEEHRIVILLTRPITCRTSRSFVIASWSLIMAKFSSTVRRRRSLTASPRHKILSLTFDKTGHAGFFTVRRECIKQNADVGATKGAPRESDRDLSRTFASLVT